MIPPERNVYGQVLADQGRDIAPLYIARATRNPTYFVELQDHTLAIYSDMSAIEAGWSWAREAVSAVAFWLWQISLHPELAADVKKIASTARVLWTTNHPGQRRWSVLVSTTQSATELTVEFRGQILPALQGQDDEVERELVRGILDALNLETSAWLDLLAPYGAKRMMSAVSLDNPLEIPAQVPVRYIEDAAASETLDELGAWLQQTYELGSIISAPADRKKTAP